MIQVQLVDPESLPNRIPGIAVHRPSDVIFAIKRGLTPEEMAKTIDDLGVSIDRGTIDASIARSQAASEPPLRLPTLPDDVSDTGAEAD